MNDAELLSAAIESSGLSARRFAVDVLGVADRTLYRWLDGRDLDRAASVRIVCKAIILRPELVSELVQAHASLIGAPVAVSG